MHSVGKGGALALLRQWRGAHQDARGAGIVASAPALAVAFVWQMLLLALCLGVLSTQSAQAQTARPAGVEGSTAGVQTQPLRSKDSVQPTSTLALILPAKVPAYSGVSQAVRAGFMAAAAAAKMQDSCLVIEHGNGEVAKAFDQAMAAGVQVVVGPLVREDLQELLKTPPKMTTIALTQLEGDEVVLPPMIKPLTLTVESDARFLARELFVEGQVAKPVVLSSDTPLMKRFADAFIDEWLALGEAPPPRLLFEAAQVATLKARLEALTPSAVLLAVEGDNAGLARAQTKAWPTYASAHIYQRQEQAEGFALDQLQVVEIPWIVTPQAERFKALPPLPASPALARLYALGYDAFQVAVAFVGGAPLSLNIDGASGRIRLDPKEGLQRSGQMAVFEGGHLLPLQLVRP